MRVIDSMECEIVADDGQSFLSVTNVDLGVEFEPAQRFFGKAIVPQQRISDLG
jgi:hypothetical protein